MRLLLHWYSCLSEYIKKYIPNKVVYVLKAEKLLTMSDMLSKNSLQWFWLIFFSIDINFSFENSSSSLVEYKGPWTHGMNIWGFFIK